MTTPGGNLADLVRQAAARFGPRPALIGDGHPRSWSQLDSAADTGAAELLESGARAGDRVLLALPSSADLAVALIAVARAGLVAVPVDPTRAELGRVAGRIRARTSISGQPVGGLEAEFRPAELAGWWLGRRAEVDAVGGGEDLALLARASRSDRAVMIPHRAVLAAVAAVASTPGLRLRADDRVLLALPLHHLAGFVTAFLPLATIGAAAVLPGSMSGTGGGAADSASLLRAIREHRVTILPGSPSIYRRLLRAEGAERALSSVRLMTSGSAPLLAEEFAAARSITGQSVWEGYGISESTSVIATSLMTSRARPGSVGLPVAGLQLRIIPDGDADGTDAADAADAPDGVHGADAVQDGYPDDSPPEAGPRGGAGSEAASDAQDSGNADSVVGSVVPAAGVERTPEAGRPEPAKGDGPIGRAGSPRPVVDSLAEVESIGEVGRIAIKGAMLFLGYWPDAADGPDQDGWYVTPDVGYTDDRGELHLVDRVDDAFVVAGFTVYPREIERALADHPYVAEAAVVGLGSERGTTVIAVITARPGTHPTDGDLVEFLTGRLPGFKRPTVFHLTSELPRTDLGRIDRRAALAVYTEATGIASTRRTPLTGVALASRGVTEDSPMRNQNRPAATDPDVVPETAAALDELGRRLPAAGPRSRRGSDDSDEDMFGEEYS